MLQLGADVTGALFLLRSWLRLHRHPPAGGMGTQRRADG